MGCRAHLLPCHQNAQEVLSRSLHDQGVRPGLFSLRSGISDSSGMLWAVCKDPGEGHCWGGRMLRTLASPAEFGSTVEGPRPRVGGDRIPRVSDKAGWRPWLSVSL